MTLVLYTRNNRVDPSEEKIETDIINCLFTITSDQSDCTIKINGVETNQVQVEYGSTVTYEISKSTYITEKGTLRIYEDTQLNARMKKDMCKFTVNAMPDTAIILIDGE